MEPRQMDKGPHADNSIARLDRATRTLIVIAVLLIEARHLKRCIVWYTGQLTVTSVACCGTIPKGS